MKRSHAPVLLTSVVAFLAQSPVAWALPANARNPTYDNSQKSDVSSSETRNEPSRRLSLRESLPESALTDYEAAMMLWEDGDFRGAQLKFQLVYERTSDPRLLWNLAVCEKALRHYAKALPLLRRYLEHAKECLSEVEQQEAQALAKAIENFVGPLRLESNQGGASVYVDDEFIGKTPLLEPLLLDMGDRKITIRKHGYKDASTHVRILGPTDTSRIFLELERDIPAATLEVVTSKGQWIWVDGSNVGRDRWEGLVSPSLHQVRITGTGYKTQTVEADLSNGGHTSVWINPRPLDRSEKGYLWPLVGVLVTVTAAIGVGAYYGLHTKDARTPQVEEGRLGGAEVGLVRSSF